jgi:hypothetical protein
MSIFNLLKGAKSGTSKVEVLKTSHTDAFADSIQLELKSVATEAVKVALEERERKFMRSILEESYFLLESLIITPKDFEIAKRFDDFLVAHESVDPDFRKNFFSRIIQSEYRTSRGGSVRVSSDFSPTVQLGQSSLENVTHDEGFQISIKGRRILFEAQASLSGPLKKEAPTRIDLSVGTEPSYSHPGTNTGVGVFGHSGTTPSPLGQQAIQKTSQVQIKLLDASGANIHTLPLPILIGRESVDSNQLPSGWSTLRVNATYVSRQQLILTEIMGECYYYLPEVASLTCMRSNGSVLEKMKLYKLSLNEHEVLNLGVDINQTGNYTRPQGPASEYSAIELSLSVNSSNESQTIGTPRPRPVP